MLIEFTVRNFRSLRDEQRLSLVATSIDEHNRTHVADSGAPGVDRVLRTAVIYGANAAGKSNLLGAMGAMKWLVLSSAQERQRGESLGIDQFHANDDDQNSDSLFEVVFVKDRVKYQFGFMASSEMIKEEWLYAYPEKRAQKWYYRKIREDGSYSYDFGSFLKGPKAQWSSVTRSNALFLSTAVQLNSEQLAPVFDWFKDTFQLVLGTGELTDHFSKKVLSSPKKKDALIKFLKRSDVAIDDIEVFDKDIGSERESIIKRIVPSEDQEEVIRDERLAARFHHRGANGKTFWLDLSEESQGTQKLFAYAGPLLDVLDNGYVLVVDEMNNSLHPLLVKNIVSLFNDPAVNEGNAQLIFSTHGTSILSTDLFRRDEIWFAEKDRDGASHIYPLTDFSPRKNASLSKGYLEGRYGAVPFLSQEVMDDL